MQSSAAEVKKLLKQATAGVSGSSPPAQALDDVLPWHVHLNCPLL